MNLMLPRLLVASVALALAVAGVSLTVGARHPDETASVAAPTPLPSWSTLRVDARDHMPASDGWFAVSVVPDRDAMLHVEIDEARMDWGVSGAAAGLVVFESQPEAGPSALWSHSLGSASPILDAGAGPTAVHCCEQAGLFPASWGGGGDGEAEGLASPDRPLWLAFAATAWDEYDTLVFKVLASGATLSIGEVRTGTGVQALDLAASSRESGTRVQALGTTVADPARIDIEWAPEHKGLVLLTASASGPHAAARLSAGVPGEGALDTEVRDAWATVAALRAGPFSFSYETLEEPIRPIDRESWVQASLFLADIDIPGDFAFVGYEPDA